MKHTIIRLKLAFHSHTFNFGPDCYSCTSLQAEKLGSQGPSIEEKQGKIQVSQAKQNLTRYKQKIAKNSKTDS